MALETRKRSTWRRQTSIRSWLVAWRVIAGLRDLGDANVPDADLNIGESRSHTRLPGEIPRAVRNGTDAGSVSARVGGPRVNFA